MHENDRCKDLPLLQLRHNKRLQHVMVPTACKGKCDMPTLTDFVKEEWPKDECDPHQTVTFGDCRVMWIFLSPNAENLCVDCPIEVEICLVAPQNIPRS